MVPLARWTGRGSLLRNSVAGFIATGADFAAVTALVWLDWVSVPVATMLGCVIGAFVNFNINRVWAFGSELGYVRQIWRYVWVSGASAALNAALVALFLLTWTGPYQTAWLAARALAFIAWNYPLHRHYVFAPAAGGAT